MSTNTTVESLTSTESLIAAYYSLTLIILGTLFNLLTFLILCRSTFRNTNVKSTLHYMRAIALFDILMLYGWNLDHYLTIVHKFHLLGYSVPTCKLITFISYFTPQTSAWLRVFICLDRYLCVSRVTRTWFHRSKSVLIIIASIIIVIFLLNLHILIFVCYRKPNGRINVQAENYDIYPLWDYVNLGVYNCLPFIVMVILNSGVVYHFIQRYHATKIRNLRRQYRAITPTLVITTTLFLIMTTPATVTAVCSDGINTMLIYFLDGSLYTYHVLSFPLYFITFGEFRRECIEMVKWNKKIQPGINLRPAI